MKTMKLSMNTRLKNLIKEKTLHYLERTTFHGFLYITRSEHYVVKSMWLLVIVFGLILCGVLFKMTLIGYYQSPTVVVVESTHFPINNLKFPAIVVCDSRNYVYHPHTRNITTIFQRRGYNKTLIEAFYAALSSFNTTHPMGPIIIKMHDLLQDLGITLPSLLDMFATPCDILISNCFWRSQKYNCTDMFYKVVHDVGYCCRFDIEYFKTNVVNSTYFGAGYMNSEGVRFLVNNDVNKINANSVNKVNFNVIPPHRQLMLTDDNIPIIPNYLYEFTIDAWLIETSGIAKLLSVHDRRCLSRNDTYNEASYHSGCIGEAFHSGLLNECNCRPFYYNSPIASDYPNCTWVQYKCIFEYLDTFASKRANISYQFNCYPDCDHVEYISLIDFAPLYKSKIGKQQSVITVHLSGTPCVKYRRNVIFTWDQLLASLGGLFGLCTGGSIISIMEFLLFVSDVLVTIILDSFKRWSKKRKISTQLGRHQVFFIRPKYDYTE